MQGGGDAQGSMPARSADSQPADGERSAAPEHAAAPAAGTQEAPAASPAEVSPGHRSLRSPISTPGSQRRRRGGRLASAAGPLAEAPEALDPASDPSAACVREAAAPRAAPPNFASALASFVSGGLQRDGAADDPGLGALEGKPGLGAGHRGNQVNGGQEARAAAPPNVLADTTRPNLLAPTPLHGKAATRKSAVGATWASSPAGNADLNPNMGPVVAAPRPPADEQAAWVVPDSAVTAGGRGAVTSGGRVSPDGSHEEAGQEEPGAAGRTPHPAGRQVRTSRCRAGSLQLGLVGPMGVRTAWRCMWCSVARLRD